MKRPLFWVCIALSVIALLHFFLSGAGHAEGIGKGLSSEDPPWNDGEVRLYGRVCGKESRGEKSYFLITDLSSDQVQNAAASRQIISMMQQRKTDRVQCLMAGEPGEVLPKIGSTVLVTGEFALFSESTNPGEFDYARYYQGKRIGGKLTGTKVLAESKEYGRIREALFALKEYFGRRLDAVFPAREAGVMRTMLLGDRSYLDQELKEVYQDGGIIHVLSISGLHVSLLGMGLYELLRRLGIKGSVACVAASVVLVLYGIMTGMSVSACRAIGMFLLRMLSFLWGRTYDLLTALGVMAAMMLCTVPVYGVNSGFWLSFASLLGVGVLLPIWEKSASEHKGGRAGCSVFLATLPLTLLFYFEVPTYSMLLNIIVVPAMGPVIFFGMIAMLVPGLGILGTVDVILLRIFEGACRAVRNLPFSSWNPGCPKAWQIVIYYVILGGILWILWAPLEEREGRLGESFSGWKYSGLWKRLGWLLCFLPTLVFLIPVHRMTGATFLDIGQGDCVILRLENGQVWINDCGSSNRKEIGEYVLLPYLKHEGIRHLDGIFISHRDEDHTNGILELLAKAKQEGIEIDCLYLPKILTGEDAGTEGALNGKAGMKGDLEGGTEEEFAEILDAARSLRGMQIIELQEGNLLRGDQIDFLILHPARNSGQNAARNSNQNSLCMLVRFHDKEGELTVLLPGDIEGEGEEELQQALKTQGICQVDILKCAHHGSKNATSQAFLDLIEVRACVISCGRNNRYGHPHAETLERLKEEGCIIYRTDFDGAVIIKKHEFLDVIDLTQSK